MNNYCIYLDESGTANEPVSDKIKHRYFCLNGIIISDNDYQDIYHRWENIRSLFCKNGELPPPMHYIDINSCSDDFLLLKNNPAIKSKFENLYHDFLKTIKITIISIVINKENHFRKYSTPQDCYHVCLKNLLERYYLFLNENNGFGSVVIEGRGHNENKLLSTAFNNFYNYGGFNAHDITPSLIQQRMNKEIKIYTKKNRIAGLEMSDMLATIIKRFILQEYGILQNAIDQQSSIDILNIVKPKIRIHNGKIKGRGIIYF